MQKVSSRMHSDSGRLCFSLDTFLSADRGRYLSLKMLKVKRVCCIGAGFVGGAFSAVIALKCPELSVTVVDKRAEKIMTWNSDRIPVHDKKLREMVKDCRNENLFFSTDATTSIREAEVIFISVPVPMIKNEGHGEKMVPDLKEVGDAARLIAEVGSGEKIIVDKSSILLKTIEVITEILKINPELRARVLTNPSIFYGESAFQDLVAPRRVIIGCDKTSEGEAAMEALRSIYRSWVPDEKIHTGEILWAQLSKMAVEAFLAHRMSTINALSMLCDSIGCKVTELTNQIRLDPDLGSALLDENPGPWEGELKNTIAVLIDLCRSVNLPQAAQYWQSTLSMNELQIKRLPSKIKQTMWSLENKKLTIFGMEQQKEWSESSESLSSLVCEALLEEGCILQVYDPILSESVIRSLFKNADEKRFIVLDDPYKATANSHAVVVCFDREEFTRLDYEKVLISMMKPTYIFDILEILPHEYLRKIGFIVETFGRDPTKSLDQYEWVLN